MLSLNKLQKYTFPMRCFAIKSQLRLENFNPRENSGSRSTNRLNLQASYAIIKILEIYDSEFTIVMDLIDDLAIFSDKDNEKINTFQIKTIGTKNIYYKLKSLLNDEVFFKLYNHLEQLENRIESINLITNVPITYSYKDPTDKKQKLVTIANSKIKLLQLDKEIVSKIEADMKKSTHFHLYGLSDKFNFSLWDVSVTTHYQVTQAFLMEFFSKRYPYLDIKTVTALHKTLFEHLIVKQSYEFELSDDMEEIFRQKSYTSKSFKALIYQATSVGTLKMETVKSTYIDFTNLLQEIQYTEALAKLKAKIFEHSELFERNFKTIEPDIHIALQKCTSKKELFEVLIIELDSKLVFELSQIERELLLINAIEEVFKRGLNHE